MNVLSGYTVAENRAQASEGPAMRKAILAAAIGVASFFVTACEAGEHLQNSVKAEACETGGERNASCGNDY